MTFNLVSLERPVKTQLLVEALVRFRFMVMNMSFLLLLFILLHILRVSMLTKQKKTIQIPSVTIIPPVKMEKFVNLLPVIPLVTMVKLVFKFI